MDKKRVRLQGLRGTWSLIDEYVTSEGAFYLWESEQYGEDVPAVLTDDMLRVLDTECLSGIYVALQDNELSF